jgi:hypothetical protein
MFYRKYGVNGLKYGTFHGYKAHFGAFFPFWGKLSDFTVDPF